MAMATTSSFGDVVIQTTGTPNSVSFNVSFNGSVCVYCEGGELTGPNVVGDCKSGGQMIDKNNTNPETYTCTSKDKISAIVFFEDESSINSYSTSYPVVDFLSDTSVGSVEGDFIAVFPEADKKWPLFANTFKGCTNLTQIDPIFKSYPVAVSGMFEGTFDSCSGLTSIPDTLFTDVTTVESGAFAGTFYECTGLTSLPRHLFANVTVGANGAFNSTFAHTGLTGFIPSTFFAGLSAQTPKPDYGNFMDNIFSGTSLATSCPTNYHTYTTGYESYFGSYKSCAGDEFVVDYSCNGGTGNAPARGYTVYGDEFTPAVNTCTPPTGKIFAGWSVRGTNTILPSAKPFTWQYNNDQTFDAVYEDEKFQIATPAISANSAFVFTLSAAGTFYVDCGDGGILTQTDQLSNITVATGSTTIERTNNTTNTYYRCRYPSALANGAVIRFAGTATSYNANVAAIKFTTPEKVKVIEGNLSAIFPYINANQYPKFKETFQGCTTLSDIPNTLFANYTSAGELMFRDTFKGCTLLSALPTSLFANITTVSLNTFSGTFEGCTGLTGYIPKTLFSSSVVPAPSPKPSCMYRTFINTGNLRTTSTGCPDGTVYYQTGYETEWNDHIVCEPGSTVSYSCGTNGTGTAPADIDVPQNTSFTPAAGTPCTGNSGYGTFTGWLISGTNEVKPAGTAFTWTYTGNKTLTAQYTPNTVALNWYNTVTTMSVDSASQSCTYDGTLTVPSAPSARTGFTFAGWEVRPTYNFSTIPNTNGVEFWAKAYEGGTKCWYDTTTGNSTEVDCASDPNFADLANTTSSNSQRFQWKVRFPDGILYGFTRCSATQGTVGEAGTPSSTFGYNGWCMATGWKPNGATSPSGPTASLQWIMGYIPSDGTTSIMNARCKRNVARACANQIRSNSSFRTALFTPAQ